MVEHEEEFQDQAKDIKRHIPSKFTKEMSIKSDVISC